MELLTEIFPELLVDHFESVFHYQLEDVATRRMELEIHLDERNHLPEGYEISDYESKGFLPASRIQDFPIRGKAVYLVIRRRRWRHKQTHKEISSNTHS